MRIFRNADTGSAARIAVTLVAAVVIQGVAGLRLGALRYFDLPLVLCVFYGFVLGKPMASVAIGSAAGLMQDSLSGVALGTNGFSKTLIGFLAASAGGKFNVDQTGTRGFALVVFTFGDGILTSMLGALAGSPPVWTYGAVLVWLVAAVVNAFAGLALFWYYERSSHAED